ncbi:hypothetical protein LshimejAT787_0104950 [Lyophyllum shimeji]|uniref:DUF6699 domain-containing protein n=1 Tax=Lyophyllum shimeji TaxID=47721 RepID=A0A9P3UJQ4_LYOSH|nr:hypothetical protein LshimejAT787_0104950 [Lyophyllum shimeji]
MSSAYWRYWGYFPPRGIPVPRKSRRESENVDTPFVPPVRCPLFPPTPLSPAYVHPIRVTQATPWSQPQSIPALPPSTPLWPSTPVVPLATPCVGTAQLGFPEFFEPGTFPALPFGSPVPIRIHPLLIYNPVNPAIPALEWDISHRAEQAKNLTGRQVLVTPDLSGPATIPSAPKMWIYPDHPVLASWMESWGPIMIEKAEISARDVLDAIWEYMQQPLTDEDVLRIEMSGEKTNLEYSARKRIRDGFELSPVARRNGYQRVDVLGGHRKFLGLRTEVFQDRTWKVFMGLTRGPVAS